MISSQKIVALSLITSLMVACGGGKDQEAVHDHTDSASVPAKDTTAITVSDTTKFKFDFTLANIPSPANAINDLKSYNVAYNKALLTDVGRVPGLAGEIKQSLNLGIMNIDMAYAMSNNIGIDVINYSRGILMVVDRLGLSSVVNGMVGKRAESNMNNRDSIYKIIDDIFIKSDDYLRTNKRVQTAATIFLGAWMEAIYLNSALYPSITNPDIQAKARKQLWDQRFYLDNIVKLMNDFNSVGELRDFNKDLTALLAEIKEAKQPEQMTDEKFKSISKKIDALRARMIN